MNTSVDTRSLNLQLRPLVAAVLLMYSTGAYTAPEFANSPGSNVSVDQSKENLTVVTQTGERALANWRSFSVQEGEVVEFIQPGASSVILNRVVGENPSEIFGKLLANGRVFLINPNGIVFGANSEVNVGGLVATTLNMKEGNRADADSFQLEEGKDAGSIVLNGTITAGQLALIAPRIENRGVVNATGDAPVIQLIAAEKVSANTTGSDLVFKVEAGHENAVIEQLGSLFAEGGRIVLIAKSSADGQPSVINTAQLNKASRILIQGDTVRLGGQFDMGGATGVLDVQASLLGQSEAVFVTGQASLKADTVNLSEAQNDFAGAVSLNTSGQVKLQDANQLVVQGRAGHLNATAENISQAAALQVDGSLVLNAVNVQLGHADNQFQGNVELDVSQSAALQGKGTLTVEGVAGSASLQAEELVLKRLESQGNLQLNAETIRQSEALLVQGNTLIESSGSVLLDHSANDFQSEVVLAGSANVALRDINNLDASGSVDSLVLHAANPNSGTVSLGDLNAQQLSVTARTVKNQEDTAVKVGGQTQLSAAQVDLNSVGNDFAGLVQLDVTQDVVLRDTNSLTVGGSITNALLKADSIVIGQSLEVGGNLEMAAREISQQAVLTVAGTTTLDGTNAATLNHAGNDFGGAVRLKNKANANLRDRNNLQVGGSAGHLALSAPAVATGQVLLDELLADSLNITGQQISQAGAVHVSGDARLSAAQVDLNHSSNSFGGEVRLAVSGHSDLQASGSLRLGGAIHSAQITAGELAFNGLTAQGDVVVNAGAIRQASGQAGALVVNGKTTLRGGNAVLSHSGNSFRQAVAIELAEDAILHSSENLELSGKAGQVRATAANRLTVSSLTSENISLEAGLVQLNDFKAQGNLTLGGGTVQQNGALVVEGETRLRAANHELQHAQNDFKGQVSLEKAGRVALGDINNLDVEGTARELILNVANTALVSTAADLQLSGQAGFVEVSAGADLVLGASQLGGLQARAAGRIEQLNGTHLKVAGRALLSADSLQLESRQNDFADVLELDVRGKASIADTDQLVLQGNARQLDANAGERLKLGGAKALSIESGKLTAPSIELNDLQLADSARLQADSITQGRAMQLAGDVVLAAQNVTLENSANDFQGSITLENVESAEIAGRNLNVSGVARNLELSAAEQLTLGGLKTQALTASARQINQMPAGEFVLVSGQAHLAAESIELGNRRNDFQAEVNLKASGEAVLADANTLSISGSAGKLKASASRIEQGNELLVAGSTLLAASEVQLDHVKNDFQGQVRLDVSGRAVLHDQNTLNVSGLVRGPAQLVAQQVQQDSQPADSLHTQGAMLIQAGVVQLANSNNRLDGGVRIEGATRVDMASQKKLSVEGSRLRKVSLSASTLELKELGQVEELSLSASGISQTAALQVQGTTRIHADQVALDNMQNDFGAEVRIAALQQQDAKVDIADRNSLSLHAGNMLLTARVEGDLNVQADNLVLNTTTVKGNTALEAKGLLSQKAAVNLNNASLKADRIELSKASNHFGGTTRVSSNQEIRIRSAGDLALDAASSTGPLALQVSGHTHVQGEQVQFEDSLIQKSLTVIAGQVSQKGVLQVQDDVKLLASGGTVDLSSSSNQFHGKLSAVAGQTRIAAQGDLNVLDLQSGGGTLQAEGRLVLHGRIEQTGGRLDFVAKGSAMPLASAEIALLLPPTLDVFSGKQAVDPVTGLGRITLASPVIEQVSGEIITRTGSQTRFDTPANGSIILTGNNQMGGEFNALAGAAYGQGFDYNPDRGSSLLAVNNDAKLHVGSKGVDADLVAIRSRGLSTPGDKALIRARMPYNDVAAGTSRSFAGLTLSLPTGTNDFGEPEVGAPIRVEVGDSSRPGLGGYMTVIPFEAGMLNPGQAIHLAGPEGKGSPTFFYDGARSLNRVPVVYNGSLLLSPQESAALTSAQGAVALARLEQTRSVVRTENVAGKVIHGVVAEVGPGRPATEGDGAARKPGMCEAPVEGLGCKP